MSNTTRILIVEDNPNDYDLAQREIRRSLDSCVFRRVETQSQYLDALRLFQPDVILCDYSLPSFDGMTALKLVREQAPLTPLIIWTGTISEDVAVECMMAGAANYVIKDNLKRLGPAILRAIEERKLVLENQRAHEMILNLSRFPEENPSPVIRTTRDGKILFANKASQVLLQKGDTATSNELPAVWKLEITASFDQNAKRSMDIAVQNRFYSVMIVPLREAGYVNLYASDITERKHSEEKLRAQEMRFRALIEHSLDSISLLSAEGILLWENPAVDRVLGYAPEAFLNRSIFELMHPDDLHWTSERFAQVVREPGSQQRGIFRLRHNNGTWRWIEARATNKLNEPGIEAVVLNYRDVTELKQAERKYQDIFEGSPVGIFQSTPQGQFININSTMAHIYGYDSPDEMVTSVLDIENQLYLTPEDRRSFAQLLEAVDTVQDFEMENIRKDGSVIWTSTSARTVRDSDGNVLYYEGFLQDVTERRNAQAQVNDLLSLNEKILDHSPLGIVTYKVTGECIFANERAASIIGATVEELRSQNFHSIKTWKTSGLYALAEKAISSKTLASRDIHQISSFGKDIWLAARCVTFQTRQEEHLLLSIVDITERKHAEEELRQKNDDLRLLNVINNAVVRGQDLNSIIDLLTSELKRIFAAVGSTIYMLSADKRSISMHQYSFSAETERSIERLLGFSIPKIEIPIKEGGHFHNVMLTKQSAITSDPQKIQEWIAEFAETRFLSPLARTAVRKLIPHIYKLLKIRSTIIVPLVSQEEVIGFLDVSGAELFTANDLRRIETIGEQLTSLIQRQQANEKVRKSEEFLQGIQNSLSAQIVILDENGTIVQVNEAWREFGDQNGLRDPNYCIGMNYLAVCEADTGPDSKVAKETAFAIRQVLSGAREEFSLEYPCHSPTEKRWYTLHITCFNDGKQKWVILAHENITERKLAEELLQQSENRYRTVIENQTEFIVRWKPDGARTFVNDAYCRYFGITREQALNTDFRPLIHEDDRGSVEAKISRLVSGITRVETDIHRVLKPDGNIYWNEWTDQALYDQDGRLAEFQAVGRDITERKQAENAIVQSQVRYQDLFDKSPVSLWQEDYSLVKQRIDALREDGVTDFSKYFDSHPDEIFELASLVKVIDVNKATLNLFHTQDKENLLKDLQTLMKEDVLQHFQKELLGLMGPTRGFVWEGPDKTFDEQMIEVVVTGTIPAGYEDDWSKVIVSIVDITENKQVEKRLRESEGRYRALFEEMPVAVWEDDLSDLKRYLDTLKQQGISDLRDYFEKYPQEIIHTRQLIKILNVNKTAMEMYQATSKEELIQSTHEYMGSGELEHWTDDLIAIANGQTSNHWEGGDETMNDTPIQISLTWTVIPGHEHDFSKVIFTTVDITERKQAEKELRQEQEKAQKYLDIAGVMMLALDQDGNLSMINQKGCEILGYSNDEIIGRNWINTFIPEDMRDEIQDVFQKLMNEDIGAASYYENPVLTKNGEQRMIAWHNTLVRNEDGMVITSLSSGEDITERKRAENELRASEERFRQLATNIEEVFWMTEAETGKELYVSPAMEKLWGSPMDAFMHEPNFYLNSVLPEDRTKVLSNIEREKNGEKVEMEYRIIRPDGSVRWVWDRAFPIFDDVGRVKILAGISTDITERKQIELEIQRHLAELEALYENGLAIGHILEPKEIGNQIIQTFARYLSWHHVTIRLLNPDTDILELIAFNQPGLGDESRAEVELRFTQMISKVGQGLSGWAMQTGEAIRTGNVHSHPQYVNIHPEILSGLYMPLKAGDRIIGCISVESDQPDAFTAQDERLLATLANQAAIAFENARLYQAAQQELFERNRAQQALWASETHYRQLADSITDILFELDQNLQFTHWNKASEMFSGVPAEDAIGKSVAEISVAADDVFKRQEIYSSVLRERQAKTFEIETSVKGSRRDLEIRAYPSARGVSVVARDVTERKVFETILKKRFELIEYANHHPLAEVMQKVIDEISALTASHVGFLHLVEDDQQTINLQTWSTETMQQYCWSDGSPMHYPLDQAGVWADAVRQRRSLIHNSYESLPDKKGLPDGHVPVHREMVIPILRDEKIVAVIGVGNKEHEYTEQDIAVAERFGDYAWDITERRRIENELAQERNQLARRVEERTADLSRANSNLARALRVKDEFLANMSHELRTPLNAILGLSESLSEQVAGPLNEKQSRYLSTINESGHHLLSLINDILDLAKIEAGQITLDINKVDVNSVCQASLRMIKQLAQKKSQEVSFEIDPDLGLMWADERRLKQMMVNLLSNAVKFTPESGRLGLEVYGDREGNKVIISVWDQGIGISENDVQRLFKPFIQLDAGLAREATGTGLGLALVAQMAQMHGGSVSVESQVGQGSRFTVMLPWEPALAGDSNSRLRTTGKFRAIRPNEVRPTVLLVEDTQEVVMMLVDYLEMAGFNMVTAQDGIDGLTQAKIAHPDLILMDIQMPRLDGFETTKKLRSDPEFKDTPIIALTALAMPNDRQRCIDAGMNEYLSKPVNLKTLSKTIKAFLYEQESNEP